MILKRGLFAAVLLLFCAGCDPTPPTEADGRVALNAMLRAHFPKVVFNVKSFSKTNGVSISPAYELHYVAMIEFPNGIAPPSAGFWNDFLAGGDVQSRLMALTARGFRIVEGNNIRQRTVMRVDSAITFVRSEKGWAYSVD